MKEKLKVSVIVPVYNAENYLSRCIDSILKQTMKEIELILVDDESTDRSAEICDSYASKDSRVKVIHKKNAGPGMARNSGLEVASGEYVAFVDSDDYIDECMYDKMYKSIKKIKADSCLCGFVQVATDGSCTYNKNPLGGNCYYDEDVIYNILLNILGSSPEAQSDFVIGIAVWKGLYSLDIIRKYNLEFYSERVYYSEDTMFNIDYFLHSKAVTVLDEMYYHYCENGTSFTKNYKTDMHDKNVRFYKQVLNMIKGLPCYTEARIRLSRLFLGFLRHYVQRIVELYDRKEAIGNLRAICEDECVRDVLKIYPYKINPIKQRIIHGFIANDRPYLVWFFVKMNLITKK